MSERYRVVPSATFLKDIERLEEHIIQCELASLAPDDTCQFRFRDVVERAMGVPGFAPHTCRRSEAHRQFRELIIPFGQGGCIVPFAIRDHDAVLLAARGQREHDYR